MRWHHVSLRAWLRSEEGCGIGRHGGDGSALPTCWVKSRPRTGTVDGRDVGYFSPPFVVSEVGESGLEGSVVL